MAGAASHPSHSQPDGSDPDGAPAARTDLNEVAQQLSDLARTLEAEDDTDAMLGELVAAAVVQIPGTEEGSVSVVHGRRDVTSQHPTSELPARVDALQAETGEGPCLDAVYEEKTVRVPDMRQEQRWPQFARRAADAGAGSMLSFQLWVKGDNLGALNLYAAQPQAFDEESEQVGLLLASHAAVALAGAQKQDQLAEKAETRDLIGQAKGILMERHKLTAARAFQLLVRYSQHSNRKLRDVAVELVDTGHLPAVPPRSR